MMQNKMKELDLKEKSSKSLLANVLDMDDDFRPSSTLPHSHVHPHHPSHAHPQQNNGGFIRQVFIQTRYIEFIQNRVHIKQSSSRLEFIQTIVFTQTRVYPDQSSYRIDFIQTTGLEFIQTTVHPDQSSSRLKFIQTRVHPDNRIRVHPNYSSSRLEFIQTSVHPV